MRFPASSMTCLLLVFMLTGCTRLRFTVDALPADDRMTETTVLDDTERANVRRTRNKVALITVSGTIVDATPSMPLSSGENPLDRFAEALRKAALDTKVKAVIIRLNSPGGTVTASDVMYREVQRFRKQTGKPVIMLMADVAASGAFYVACAGDEVIAHPTSVTGSIGVIIQTFNFAEGMQRIGIRADAITSGPNKSMGSPFEPMSTEHRDLLQGLVDEFYSSFREIVVTNRTNLEDDVIDEITDGRVVTGSRAAEIGLIDRTGDLYDAFESAKQHAKIPAARLVKYHRPADHVGSAYGQSPNVAPNAGALELNLLQLNLGRGLGDSGVGFYYLWDPSVW